MAFTATDTYGFGVFSPSGYDRSVLQQNVAMSNPTPESNKVDNSSSGLSVAGFMSGHHALGWNNPLFWCLILLLLFVGYVGFAFDADLKRVGDFRVRGGSRS